MKVLIYGSGFIALNFVKLLFDLNEKVNVTVIYNHHRLEGFNNVRHISAAEKDNVDEFLRVERLDYVVLLQGNSVVSGNTCFKEAVQNNMLDNSLFLQKIYETGCYKSVKKILVVGSASEYGKFYNEPISESFDLHPTSLYGLSKIFLYNSSQYFVERGLPIVYARQFNTIGPDQRDSFVLPSFAKQIAKIEKKLVSPVVKVGDLSQERDFLDVRDTCSAYLVLLRAGEVGTAYNVGSGQYVAIKFLLDRLLKKSNVDRSSLKIVENQDLFPKEASLSKRLHANVDRLKALGFVQRFTLDRTIQDVLDYWRKNV